ncbi:MAG: nitroreductase family protein [Pseudomonadota bacterium]|nr:nitroreductase family protein [Pseudomonadota bacterium]
MWDFFETVRNRHSVRRYQSDMPVEREKLHAILETAMSAPSAGDLQSYQMDVVTSEPLRQALQEAAPRHRFIAAAPTCLVVSADQQRPRERFGDLGSELFCIQDATIVAAYAQLAAVAAGLASGWVGSFDEARVCDLLSLEPHLRPVAILTIGYPAELPELTPRRHLEDVVRFR